MRRNLLFASIILLAAVANSCQYPVGSSDLPTPQRFIVIDAELSETYARVRVTYTLTEVTPQGAYLFPKPPVATAYVLDSKGRRTDFKIDGSRDTTFRGVIGETYKLYVTADGETYESTAETMRPCPEIDSLYPLYTREPNRDAKDLLYDGFDVYAEFKDYAGQADFYQWDWVHYERRISCDKVREGDKEVQVPCTPYDCWGIKYNTRVIAQSDNLRDGTPIAQRLLRIPFAYPPNKYYLRVEQRAVTQRVYEYLKALEIQTQNVGSLFDIPAQTLFSPNVVNINNPKEQILGVFNVFSARKKVIFIDMQQEIPGAKVKFIGDRTPFHSNPLLQAACVEGQFRTKIRPEGWID